MTGAKYIHHAHPDGGEGLMAIVVWATYDEIGTRFLTSPDNSLQLGVIRREGETEIKAHRHPPSGRLVEFTQEVLMVRSGAVAVTIYTSAGEFVETVRLTTGDVILLMRGGHSVKFCDLGATLLEVKQGPHLGDRDKVPLEVK